MTHTLATIWARCRMSEDRCWLWTGAKDYGGYGMVGHEGKTWRVPRLVWMLTHEDPGSLHVCHSCDEPSCANPKHLFVGTAQDNALDREGKGRGTKGRCKPKIAGENAPTAKLTWIKVAEIRYRHAEGERPTHLAREYGVHRSTVEELLRGDTWKTPGQ